MMLLLAQEQLSQRGRGNTGPLCVLSDNFGAQTVKSWP